MAMNTALAEAAPPGRLRRALSSDLLYAFRRSPLAILAFLVTALFVGAAALAPLIAPQNPFDPANLDLLNSLLPPVWEEGGDPQFLLGTDDQGRDMLSAILYGMRISLLVGLASVALALVLGVALRAPRRLSWRPSSTRSSCASPTSS